MEIWNEAYPDKTFTPEHLSAQVANIKARKLLSPDEVANMKEEILRRNRAGRSSREARRSVQVGRATNRRNTVNQQRLEDGNV
ncbi:MAG: hypothetical protein KTM48_01225, partial [Wolbachia endosymbiont of Pissodes strobi]|nr:hypothetical protein [Wolbachia endosymbiont of Pissodes strobi]